MENIGKEPSICMGRCTDRGIRRGILTAAYTLPTGQNFADDFHLFAAEWEPQQIRFYVDGTLYATYTPVEFAAAVRHGRSIASHSLCC